MATTPSNTSASSTSTGPTATKPTVPTQKRGDNRQPKRQIYKTRPSQTVKRWTETFKSVRGVSRLTPEQRGAIAFFTLSSDRSAN